ncbi:MAG: CARDB domain-containing protein [Rubrivivax sp.]|nr:CARDB domain-containing protein [Rubrivivax sp.]
MNDPKPRRRAPWHPAASAVALLAALHGTAWAQCDLKADVVFPSGSLVGGGSALAWKLSFANIAASGSCAANQVRLNRYAGTTASGSATTVGGSGSWQPLPALAPGQSVQIDFSEASPPTSGTHTYKLAYASPHNDANNGNHHTTKTVEFTASAIASKPTDLRVLSVGPTEPLRIGSCNTVRVRVGNAGGSYSGLPVLALRVYRPGLPNNVADSKTVPIGELAAGQTREFRIDRVRVPQDGPWQVGVVVDATQLVAESSETNNHGSFTANDLSAACPG